MCKFTLVRKIVNSKYRTQDLWSLKQIDMFNAKCTIAWCDHFTAKQTNKYGDIAE